jgi:predicted outer membrane repeat protein
VIHKINDNGAFVMESLLGGAVFRHRSGRVVALGSTAVLAAAGAGPLIMLTSSTASANAALVVSTLADSGAGSLRQAMLDANAAAGVDTITFTAGLTGTIDVLSDLPQLDGGIDLQGPGESVITIDGGWTDAGGPSVGNSLFVLDNLDVADGASTISGVTITGGNSYCDSCEGGGGAIRKDHGDADLTITNVVLSGNYAETYGGAVHLYNADGTVTIRDSVISNNVAGDDGGALYANGDGALVLTLNNVEITGNTADDDGGGIKFEDGTLTIVESTISGNTAGDGGGGIWFYNGTLTISDTTISGNTAGYGGGGIFGNDGSLTISDTTISGNTADYYGGGIYFEDGTLAIVESTISGNTAGDGGGGGLWLDDVDGTISDTTISGNTAGDGGGGIYLYETLMTISNSTLSGNSADRGGALYIKTDDLDDYGSATFIENSTISGNHATQDGGAIFTGTDEDEEEEIASLEIEIVQSTITDNSTDGLGENVGGIVLQDYVEATMTGSIVAGNLGNDIGLYDTSLPSVNASNSVLGVIQSGVTLIDGGGTQVGVTDPMLGLLANNGGVTKTHALLAGSPAIDAGPNPVPVFDGNEFDQRGVGFARIVFGVADVGAFEVQEPEPEPTPEPLVPTFTG